MEKAKLYVYIRIIIAFRSQAVGISGLHKPICVNDKSMRGLVLEMLPPLGRCWLHVDVTECIIAEIDSIGIYRENAIAIQNESATLYRW